MKFSKLILLSTALLMSGALMAEVPKDIPVQTPPSYYVGYETTPNGWDVPSLGYRYNTNDFIFDGSLGYKYQNTNWGSVHHSKANVNVYKPFFSTNYGNPYGGVGAEVRRFHSTRKRCESHRETFFLPVGTLGHEFVIDGSKKVFVEILYKPYIFGKDHSGKYHSTSLRMGVSL